MMAGVYLLTPALQRYQWGTTDVIAALLGIEATDQPLAEAWWGAHPDAPALAAAPSGDVPLTDLLAADAVGILGDDVAKTWGNALPYLLKVLSVSKPLSIQVHPSAEQARAGYDRERTGGAHAAGSRYAFADRLAKPEMVVALTPMVVLAGFRPVDDLARDLALIGGDAPADLDASSVGRYLRDVLALPRHAPVLTAMVAAAERPGASRELTAAAAAAVHHPGDQGALIALALRCIDLSPGEALFIDAGVVHSYQTGTGLEVMANSDNVVRAGLTPKPVNAELFLELADTSARMPQVIQPVERGGARVFTTPAPDYELTLVDTGPWSAGSGPRIVLAVDGSAQVRTDQYEKALHAGQAVLVADRDGPVDVTSTGLAAVVSVPQAGRL
ncbi:MAG: mannose-6-phosphate isomerase, class I [Actinobacteria bacterium HGW-Actinobacteria-4]|nr:MAG: mannose-6-phosphate isomerase, class I [Actinobacteria bacterium HGW-Actinobacteria-4]